MVLQTTLLDTVYIKGQVEYGQCTIQIHESIFYILTFCTDRSIINLVIHLTYIRSAYHAI